MKRKLISLSLSFLLSIGIAGAMAQEPILPDVDPPATGPTVKLTSAVAGKHPRLLITEDQIAKLKDFYNSPKGAAYRQAMQLVVDRAGVPPSRKTDNHDWGQSVGLFEMPSVAMHYVLTGDKKSFDTAMAYLKWLSAEPNWTFGGAPDMPFDAAMDQLKKMPPAGENNSDTTAAFTMVGAAITWDWLYKDIDPTFREQFRQVLWQHARAMYWGGHMSKNPGGGYWRGVPMYNHRWFRDWGLTFAAVAATEAKPDEQWLLGKVMSELQFMANWLPADGSNHEGPGYGSSSGALGETFLVSDSCLGTHHYDQPFFHHLSQYALDLNTPGMTQAFYFADCFTKARSVHPFYLFGPARDHQADVLDGVRRTFGLEPNAFGIGGTAWFALIADDPSVQGGSYKKLPTTSMYSDLGLAIVRENWEDNAVAAMFKCGPPGGYNLNAWRPTATGTDGKLPYINIAHDHPDANTFSIFCEGDYAAETDRYCEKPGKLTSSLNGILVNGIGQAAQGRPEGQDWAQPSSEDMTSMGKITAWKDAGKVVVAEGEAAGSYLAYTDRKTNKSRPALDRARRTFIWVKGGYILVLDDLRSPQSVDFTWLMQGKALTAVDAGKGQYELSKNAAKCGFQLLSDGKIEAKMGTSTANDHSKPLGWQQLQATVSATAVRFVSVFDPWHRGVKLAFTPSGPDKATVTVTGEGINDTWNWQSATGKFTASTLRGELSGGVNVAVDAQSAPPPAIPPPHAY